MRTIEYIGAAPVKKKRRSPLGGWLLVVFALSLGGYFLRPLFPFLLAQQDTVSDANVKEAIQILKSDADFGSLLAAAALERTQSQVTFDRSYFRIDFPGGDIRSDRGKAEDVVIRAYRKLGIDLQVDVHEDLKLNFYQYPQLFDAKGPDTNIDHRRVQNLQRFFTRKGESLAVTRDPIDYEFGDLVVWQLLNGDKHIGIVVPGPGAHRNRRWVVHNNGNGPVWEDSLMEFRLEGHYRYQGLKGE